jgi:hypothetical protein
VILKGKEEQKKTKTPFPSPVHRASPQPGGGFQPANLKGKEEQKKQKRHSQARFTGLLPNPEAGFNPPI